MLTSASALQLPRWSITPPALPWAIRSLPVLIFLDQFTWFKLQTLACNSSAGMNVGKTAQALFTHTAEDLVT